MPPDNELVETSRRRIEQQKQAQQLQQILGCIADGKGTVDAQQARMAAQLAGVSLPDGALKPAAGADSPRVSVRPLVSAVLPKQQGAKPPQASPRQRSEKPVYNLAAVLGDGGEIDPAVRRAWEYFSGRLKENFDLIGILFRRADEDSSGKLSRFELHKMLHEMDRTPGIADKDRHRTISKLIDLADIDGDGEINYKEFLQFLKAGVPGQAELQKAREDAPVDAATAELRQAHALVSKRIQERFGGVGGLTAAFRSIDEDKSGSLTLYELKQARRHAACTRHRGTRAARATHTYMRISRLPRCPARCTHTHAVCHELC